MLKFEEAKAKILELTISKGIETLSLQESFYRVLAEDIFANRDFPDKPKSAVDGFAIKGVDNKCFQLLNTYSITEDIDYELKDGEAVFVMTGGVVPANAETVLRIEDCVVEGNLINYDLKIKQGNNINKVGEESIAGDLIVGKGSIINERVFSSLAYAGVKEVKVYTLPRVAFFTTGDEILNLEDDYKPGYIFNTNRYIFEKAAKRLGIEVNFYGNVKDDEENISRVINELSQSYDILVTSGGISMGKYDFVKKILNEQNYEVVVNKTSIKPGSPLMVAKSDKSVIFGLPGYPAAFLTNMFLYLIPFLKKSMSRKDFDHKFLKAELKSPMHSRINSDYFNRALVELDNGKFFVYDANSQKTSHFLNFANCNGLFRIPEGIEDVDEGFIGDLMLFDLEL